MIKIRFAQNGKNYLKNYLRNRIPFLIYEKNQEKS